jgi:hypothetical protein
MTCLSTGSVENSETECERVVSWSERTMCVLPYVLRDTDVSLRSQAGCWFAVSLCVAVQTDRLAR